MRNLKVKVEFIVDNVESYLKADETTPNSVLKDMALSTLKDEGLDHMFANSNGDDFVYVSIEENV